MKEQNIRISFIVLFTFSVFMLSFYIFYTAFVSILSSSQQSSQSSQSSQTLHRIVNTLYRQCARWAVAAQQDANEIIRVLHANYATGYLWAIKDIVTPEDFKHITGQDYMSFEKKVVEIQDQSTRLLVAKCKTVVPIVDEAMVKAIYSKDQS